MKHHFVTTDNYQRLMAAVRFMDDRGSRSGCLCLLHGDPGVGKTCNITHWGAANGAVFIKGHVGMNLKGLRWAISNKLGVKHGSNPTEELEDQIAAVRGGGIRLILDEAQYGLSMRKDTVRAAGIEYLRDVAERGDSYAILICHNSEVPGFSESKHIRTRIAHRCELHDASMGDTLGFLRELCEVSLADEVGMLVHKQTGGKYRLVESAIATLERIAKAKNVDCLTLSDVENVALVVDHEQTLVPKVAPKKKK